MNITMYLVYLDESGNTGTNLTDLQQPVFVLAAMIVAEEQWQDLERRLATVVERYFPDRPEAFEVHAQEFRNGKGFFHGWEVAKRLQFRDEWFRIANETGVRVVYRAIDKSRFRHWIDSTFGSGVAVNPHVAAFPLVAVVVNEYLSNLEGSKLGIFISDENLEVARDVEKSIRFLRGTDGVLRLNCIIEKGFFVESRQSLALQLCDLVVYALRKHAEPHESMKAIDRNAYARIEPLIHRGNERLMDVIG